MSGLTGRQLAVNARHVVMLLLMVVVMVASGCRRSKVICCGCGGAMVHMVRVQRVMVVVRVMVARSNNGLERV